MMTFNFGKISTYLSLIFLLLLSLTIFRKFFIQGLLPIPYNILVGWYFPYNLGGWEDYQPGIFFKGGLYAADVFRQMIPWKMLAIESIKSSQMPFWNPYAFSGEPLLANIQATIFYPLTVLFFLISNFDYAWSIYIVLTPIIASVGMYWFLKNLKLSNLGAVIGAIAFGFSGHMISWMQWGVVTHSAIWLPYILLSLSKILNKNKSHWFYSFLLIFSIFSTITGGYPQESSYVLLISGAYGIFNWLNLTKKLRYKKFVKLFFLGLIVLFLASLQLIPTANLYKNSALEGETSQKLFSQTGLSWKHVLTLFAPDYYGNRITNNYWADSFTKVDYIQANLFIGTIPLIFFLMWLLKKDKSKLEILFFCLTVFGIFIGLNSPVNKFWANLHIPMLSTGVASGSLFLVVTNLSIISGFGVDDFLRKKSLINLIFVLHIYLFFAITLIFVPENFQKIAARNSVIPLGMVGSSLMILLFWKLIRIQFIKKQQILYLGMCFILLFLQSIETIFYTNKIFSFSPPDYSFPEHILLSELQKISGLYRSTGFWDSDITTNLHTKYKIYSTEGYNPLHLLSYQEFTSATKTGDYNKENIARSDADLDWLNQDTRNRFLQLTSTKYITAKVTDPNLYWEIEPLKYDPKNFKLVWQQEMFKIYEFNPILERASLYNSYEVISDKSDRIARLYSPDYDPFRTLILEDEVSEEIQKTATGTAQIIDYQPNSVLIESNIKGGNMLLMLNDTFDNGWKVKIDQKEKNLLRANHTFRAVIVPEGNHLINFYFDWKIFNPKI